MTRPDLRFSKTQLTSVLDGMGERQEGRQRGASEQAAAEAQLRCGRSLDSGAAREVQGGRSLRQDTSGQGWAEGEGGENNGSSV